MIIVAIDEINLNKAVRIIDQLDPKTCMVKIGSVTFNSIGHEIIYYAVDQGLKIFSIQAP
jgi:Orotidine-5''-phosphate decarboxylase